MKNLNGRLNHAILRAEVIIPHLEVTVSSEEEIEKYKKNQIAHEMAEKIIESEKIEFKRLGYSPLHHGEKFTGEVAVVSVDDLNRLSEYISAFERSSLAEWIE